MRHPFPTKRLRIALGTWVAIETGGVAESDDSAIEGHISAAIEGAYAAFEEDRKGSLEAGKMADFAMLSGDIMTIPAAEILKTRVTMTVAGGKIVFRQ